MIRNSNTASRLAAHQSPGFDLQNRLADDRANPLEDYIDAISTLPYEVQRSFNLMQTLDRKIQELLTEVLEEEKNHVLLLKRKLRESHDKEKAKEYLRNHGVDAVASIRSKRQQIRQLSGEKLVATENIQKMVVCQLKILESELASFEQHLAVTGALERVAAAGEEVAARLTNNENEDWILARVVEFNPDQSGGPKGEYTVVDVDDSVHTYTLSQQQVILLQEMPESWLRKGEKVLAVYPDTTSFYPATISQAPKRPLGLTSATSFLSSQPQDALTCQVQFAEDSDEHGVTPHRIIPCCHIIRPSSEKQGS